MVSIDYKLATILRELCILRYRGCRAGRNKICLIQSTQPSTRTHRQYFNNKSNTRPGVQSSNLLRVICNDTVKSPTCPSTCRIIPRTYILNAASLAKSHAINCLQAELERLEIEVAVVTETHFHKQHSQQAFDLSNFNCVRQDRKGRKGGGVAMYTKNDITFDVLQPTSVLPEYETIWLRLNWLGSNIVFVAVYHPPKPIYNLSVFKDFLSNNVDSFLSNNDAKFIVLAGDFNQFTARNCLIHWTSACCCLPHPW